MYKIRLDSGVLPNMMCLGLLEHDAFDGSFLKSSLNFKTHDLLSIDVQVNSQSINFFPLTKNSGNVSEFYHHFLKVILIILELNKSILKTGNFLDNPFCSGVVDLQNYERYNFLIPVNLAAQNLNEGELTVVLKFNRIIEKQIDFIYMPTFKKQLVFNNKYEPAIEIIKDSSRKRKHE